MMAIKAVPLEFQNVPVDPRLGLRQVSPMYIVNREFRELAGPERFGAAACLTVSSAVSQLSPSWIYVPSRLKLVNCAVVIVRCVGRRNSIGPLFKLQQRDSGFARNTHVTHVTDVHISKRNT